MQADRQKKNQNLMKNNVHIEYCQNQDIHNKHELLQYQIQKKNIQN